MSLTLVIEECFKQFNVFIFCWNARYDADVLLLCSSLLLQPQEMPCCSVWFDRLTE